MPIADPRANLIAPTTTGLTKDPATKAVAYLVDGCPDHGTLHGAGRLGAVVEIKE